MQAALCVTATVHEGGRIEMIDPQLPSGEDVDVIILFPAPPSPPRHSIVDVLAEAPVHLLFQIAADVDDYLRGERDARER